MHSREPHRDWGSHRAGGSQNIHCAQPDKEWPRHVTRDLRILHVLPGFKIGGAQMRLVELAKGFGESFAHTIIALDGHYTAAQLFSPDTRITLGGIQDKTGSLPQRLARYRRAIADHAPDLLMTYNWGSIEWAMANAIGGVPH